MWFTDVEIQAIVLSVKVAVWSTGLSFPIAVLVGYAMARYSFWGKSLLEAVLHLPLVMPPVTTGYLLLLLLGTNGIVGKWLFASFGWRIGFSFTAAVLAAIVVSFPLFVRSVRTAVEMVDPGLEEAARILGAGWWRTFIRISLPLALPGILSGGVLSFARALGEFGATITFAGNIVGETQTLPLAIYSYMQVPGQENATVRLVLVSVAISLVTMVLSEWMVKRMKR